MNLRKMFVYEECPDNVKQIQPQKILIRMKEHGIAIDITIIYANLTNWI